MNTRTMAHKRTAAVISLNYTYAYTSHMIALGKLLEALGFVVTFILDEKYLSRADFGAIGDAISRGLHSKSAKLPFDLAIFCNSATQNHSFARELRQQETTVLYIYHEPEFIWSQELLRSEGMIKTARFIVSTYCSVRTLRESSGVIVSSSHARTLYERNYGRLNSNVNIMPLLFDDEIGEPGFESMRQEKRFFGFVGTACKAHAFDAFVACAKYALRNGSTIPFAIATRVDLSSFLRADREFGQLVNEGRIHLQHGRELSNDEINHYSLSCFCVWNVYRRSTQSGVLPRAFMAGSPVLTSRIGSFPEYVHEGFTGEFADLNDGPAAILDVVARMQEHCLNYVDRCRKSFMDTFYWKANLNRLAEIIDKNLIGINHYCSGIHS